MLQTEVFFEAKWVRALVEHWTALLRAHLASWSNRAARAIGIEALGGAGPMRALSVCLVGLTATAMIALGTAWNAPPRFDGAGYAVLALSITEGQGYRSIDHPDEPPHAHFPPGYPLALAIVGTIAREDVRAFHLFSLVCTVGATLAAHRWFRFLYGDRVAFMLGMALATNWAWVRAGGAIQSEPLFELLGQLAILAAYRVRGQDDPKFALILGSLLGVAFLTRHVAIALIAAIFLDLALARRWRNLAAASILLAAIAGPWIVWTARISASAEGTTQAELLAVGKGGIVARIVGQALFYARRIPDQLTGPYVEVATVFQRSPVVEVLADAWAISASLVVVIGWIGLLGRSRRRLAGLIPLITMAILLLWPFTEAGRFLIPLIPCLLIGAIAGLTWLGRISVRALGKGGMLSRSRLCFLAAVILLIGELPYSAYDLARGRLRLQEAGHRDFDDACDWLASSDRAHRPGPVLTRHPGEVYLRTGRKALDISTSERPGARDAGPEEVAATIARYKVAYLLIDDGRYANAPPSPLSRFVTTHPERVLKTWDGKSKAGTVAVYEVVRDR